MQKNYKTQSAAKEVSNFVQTDGAELLIEYLLDNAGHYSDDSLSNIPHIQSEFIGGSKAFRKVIKLIKEIDEDAMRLYIKDDEEIQMELPHLSGKRQSLLTTKKKHEKK